MDLTATSDVDQILARADDRAAWLEWRRHGIGGSDIAGIIGLSRWASPWSVWADKVGLREPTAATDRQHIGLELEPVLDGLFTRRTGLHVAGQQTWCIDTDAPWRRCTVDGFAYEGPRDWSTPETAWQDGGPIKEAADRFAGALGTVQHKTDNRYHWPDGPPPDMRAQCIWEMGVTRLPHAWLSVMHGGFTYAIHEIPFDPDDWQFMCEAADRFWTDHVLTGIAPTIDGSDATRDALKAVYPEEEPGARAEVTAYDVEEWHTYAAARKAAEKAEQDASNRIRAALEDAEIGTVDGAAAVTLRVQTKRTTCKACGHVEESEPFRVLRDAPKKLRDLPPVDA